MVVRMRPMTAKDPRVDAVHAIEFPHVDQEHAAPQDVRQVGAGGQKNRAQVVQTLRGLRFHVVAGESSRGRIGGALPRDEDQTIEGDRRRVRSDGRRQMGGVNGSRRRHAREFIRTAPAARMIPGRPSATAMRVAARRAAHQILDRPLVLEDPLALRIIGPQQAAALEADPAAYDRGWGRGLRAFLVARSRVAEDALAVAVAGGLRQYVVLGAGLDTFAYRNGHAAAGLRVFEVDYPATQAWKLLERLREGGSTSPRRRRIVPVDFERQRIVDELARGKPLPSIDRRSFPGSASRRISTRRAVMATLPRYLRGHGRRRRRRRL